jgi:hypothetical protein
MDIILPATPRVLTTNSIQLCFSGALGGIGGVDSSVQHGPTGQECAYHSGHDKSYDSLSMPINMLSSTPALSGGRVIQ